MATNSQIVNGFFERFSKDASLCRIPFYDNSVKLFNVLETIQGQNGIKIVKSGNDGNGWYITLDNVQFSLPDGDSTNVSLKWDNTNEKWTVVKPIFGTDAIVAGAVGTDDYICVGAITSGDDSSLIQLQMQKFPSISAAVSDYVDNNLNSIPDGDSTDVSLKWDTSGGGWDAVLPVHGTDDNQSGNLSFGDYVVTGIKTGPAGSLIQLEKTQLPTFPPSGWVEETLDVVTDEGIKTRTVLVKSADSADVETWDTGDYRLLLQVDSSGKLTIEKGFFKE